MDILAMVLFGIGALVCAGSGIWYLIVTFQKSVLWGVANLFIPFAGLAFLIKHFQEAWKPCLLSGIGAIMVGVSAAIFIPAHPELFPTTSPFAPPQPNRLSLCEYLLNEALWI